MAWDNEKKKVKTAVAVAYEPGDKAPKILASGRGEVAEKIIAKAKENDVPFYKDNKLAETLSKLEIGDAIPPELYEVVAEILVFVEVKYRADNAAGNPLEAVTAAKQRTISKVASYYCLTHGYGTYTPCRFDVAAILGEQIKVIQNAFDYQGF